MARVLVVDDEPGLVDALVRGFSDIGYVVETAGDGEAALARLAAASFDVVVADVMMPRLNGIELIRRIRRDGSSVPIVLLTARDEIDDVVRGLDAGANDYLTKPFAFRELAARVRAIMRGTAATTGTVVELGELRVDTTARRVQRGESLVELASLEYRLLEHLATRVGRIVAKRALLETVWGRADADPNLVEACMTSLRKKIDAPGAPSCIRTIRGLGYRFGGGAQ